MKYFDIISYKLGVGYGQELNKLNLCKNIQDFNFLSEENFNKTIKELRNEPGINKEELRARYRKEKLLIPTSLASSRLPVDSNINITMARIKSLDGADYDWYDKL